MYWYTLSIWPQTYKIQILLESVLCTNLYAEEHTWENYSKRQVLWYSLLPPCPALYNSQHSNYSASNTCRTPGDPSEVPLGTSTTTSAIKIGEVTIFFSAFGRTPPHQPLVRDPRSATPLALGGHCAGYDFRQAQRSRWAFVHGIGALFLQWRAPVYATLMYQYWGLTQLTS